jgi:hypothetical protein
MNDAYSKKRAPQALFFHPGISPTPLDLDIVPFLTKYPGPECIRPWSALVAVPGVLGQAACSTRGCDYIGDAGYQALATVSVAGQKAALSATTAGIRLKD